MKKASDWQRVLHGLNLVMHEVVRTQDAKVASRVRATAGHYGDLLGKARDAVVQHAPAVAPASASASAATTAGPAAEAGPATAATAAVAAAPASAYAPTPSPATHVNTAAPDVSVTAPIQGTDTTTATAATAATHIPEPEQQPVVIPHDRAELEAEQPVVAAAAAAAEAEPEAAPVSRIQPTVVNPKQHRPKHNLLLPAFDEHDEATTLPKRTFRERAVPSTSLGRAMGFGSLAAGLAVGSAGAFLKRSVGASDPEDSLVLTPANAERLASAFCKMRGAALKIGQMLSIQDDNAVPKQIRDIMERVRQQADIMPRKQLETVLRAELGDDWQANFSSFDFTPMAAASIGQVHHGVLQDGRHVAVKVQYPGVANSIDSDLDNVKRVMTVMDIFPKGLYVDELIDAARAELKVECNYEQEARNQRRFRENVASDPVLADFFVVPEVIDELSARSVLTTILVAGEAIDKSKHLSQDTRNNIARRLLQLTLQELFEFRFMQTDPNFGNFLYDARRDVLGLLDFGAAREYPKHFVDEYLRLVWSAANSDRQGIIDASIKLGMITGHESPVMMDAHIAAGMVMGEPFLSDEPYDFAKHMLTTRLSSHASVFAEHRLKPPPHEIYSLHRRLAGAYLICIHLGANIEDPRQILAHSYATHVWDDNEPAEE